MKKYHYYKLITSICDTCENPKNCLKNNIYYKRALDDTTHQFGRYSFYLPKTTWYSFTKDYYKENFKHLMYMYSLKDWKIYKTQRDNETWLRLGYCGTYNDFMRSGLLSENTCDNYEKVNEHIVSRESGNGFLTRDYGISDKDKDKLDKYIEE